MAKNKKRKICIVTGSRAEYGLLSGLMKEIRDDRSLVLQVVAAGMHLEDRFGNTYREIVKDGFVIDAKVDMKLERDDDELITRSVGRGIIGFGRAFNILKPDIIVLLGDRFETLAAASAAVLARIPIAHIHGGEVTEGAYDDSIRHAVTKLSFLHFTSHKNYKNRILRMGEDPKRVFNCGAPGIDNIKRTDYLSKNDLEKQLGIELGKDVALVTYHPTTLEKGQAKDQIKSLLRSLDQSGLRMIFTMPNADSEQLVIWNEIRRYVENNRKEARLFKSLGSIRYLSLLRYVGLMVGNSSSGIIEAPSFALPVVNIGDRQKGRIRAKNVIDSCNDANSIKNALKKAVSSSFVRSLKGMRNPFGDGHANQRIMKKIKTFDLSNVKKKFYDYKGQGN